jgi:hypothetical protein
MPAQAADVVTPLAGKVRVKVEKNDGFEIQHGIHEAHNNQNGENKRVVKSRVGRCTAVATALDGRRDEPVDQHTGELTRPESIGNASRGNDWTSEYCSVMDCTCMKLAPEGGPFFTDWTLAGTYTMRLGIAPG